MTTEIHTVADLMQAAANAYHERDFEALLDMHNKVRDWLQSEAETEAQIAMIEAFMEAVELSDD